MATPRSVRNRPHTTASPITRPAIVIGLVAIVAIVAVLVFVVFKPQSTAPLNLAGHWITQYAGFNADVTLAGSGNDYTGKIVPQGVPASATLSAHLQGTTATVRINDGVAIHTGMCSVSNTKIVCHGTGKDANVLSLTLTRANNSP